MKRFSLQKQPSASLTCERHILNQLAEQESSILVSWVTTDLCYPVFLSTAKQTLQQQQLSTSKKESKEKKQKEKKEKKRKKVIWTCFAYPDRRGDLYGPELNRCVSGYSRTFRRRKDEKILYIYIRKRPNVGAGWRLALYTRFRWKEYTHSGCRNGVAA